MPTNLPRPLPDFLLTGTATPGRGRSSRARFIPAAPLVPAFSSPPFPLDRLGPHPSLGPRPPLLGRPPLLEYFLFLFEYFLFEYFLFLFLVPYLYYIVLRLFCPLYYYSRQLIVLPII